MRKSLAIILTMTVITAGACKSGNRKGHALSDSHSVDTGKAVISFASLEHDFGRVSEGEKVGCIFSFTNTGTSDLILTNATTSCGCTVPKYDRNPIAPGSQGSVEVVFDTGGRNGIQTKSITVNSNAAVPVVLLQIKAEVIPKDK
jgi:hypothetical protein